MIPSPRKPKLSLLGWMSFSLRVWLEVTRSIPMLGLAGRARVGLSSSPLTAAELFLTELEPGVKLGTGEAESLSSSRLELGSSLAAALVWVLVTRALLVGEVELGPEAELSLSLASLFLASAFLTVFLSFLVAAGAGTAPVTSASNSSFSSDSGD